MKNNTAIDRVTIMIPSRTENESLLAYADVSLDGHIIVRNFQVMRRSDGTRDIRVPKRPFVKSCPACHLPCSVTYKFCPHCSKALPEPDDSNRTTSGNLRTVTSVVYSVDPKWTAKMEAVIVTAVDLALETPGILTQSFDVRKWDGETTLSRSAFPVGRREPPARGEPSAN